MFRNVLFALALLVILTPGYARAQAISDAQPATASCSASKALWSTYQSNTHWPREINAFDGRIYSLIWGDQNLPRWFPFRLQTDAWMSIVPDIYQRYSGQSMEVRMRRPSPFQESCDSAGNLTVSFHSTFEWYADTSNGIYSSLFMSELSGRLRPLRLPNGTIVAEVLGTPSSDITQNFINDFNPQVLSIYELYLTLNNHWCDASLGIRC
ncbi:MAG: hypothetical protein KGN02_13100 [bacterium]|nr:hypothetical protein [bacterium]